MANRGWQGRADFAGGQLFSLVATDQVVARKHPAVRPNDWCTWLHGKTREPIRSMNWTERSVAAYLPTGGWLAAPTRTAHRRLRMLSGSSAECTSDSKGGAASSHPASSTARSPKLKIEAPCSTQAPQPIPSSRSICPAQPAVNGAPTAPVARFRALCHHLTHGFQVVRAYTVPHVLKRCSI